MTSSYVIAGARRKMLRNERCTLLPLSSRSSPALLSQGSRINVSIRPRLASPSLEELCDARWYRLTLDVHSCGFAIRRDEQHIRTLAHT